MPRGVFIPLQCPLWKLYQVSIVPHRMLYTVFKVVDDERLVCDSEQL
jgi:hypothetical protein